MRPLVNVVFAGVGGSGVIGAADLLADAAFRAGHDVKQSNLHGTSRQGPVTCDVRYGRQVLSPIVPAGDADYVVVLAARELDRARPLLRPGGVLLEPSLVAAGAQDARAVALTLLGALSVHLDLPDEAWRETLRGGGSPERDERAFAIGRDAARGRGAPA